jgi:hypothetical protein
MRCEEHKCKSKIEGTNIKYIFINGQTMKVCLKCMNKWFYSKDEGK